MQLEKLVIGTRGSQLALYQANYMKDILSKNFPELLVEIKIIKTKGDKILDVSLSKIGDKGLFTKELEVELINGTIDIAVHSLKDMPTQLPEGLKLAAVSERGDINDALVSFTGKKLKDLTPEDRVATSSLRRRAGLLNYNKNITIVDIRGNVNTRLKKMEDGYCDAMIMAYTGLKRLGLEKHVSEIISPDIMIPAVSQGAIGVETVTGRPELDAVMQQISNEDTWISITAERAFMRTLEGGCQVPVGCYTELKEGRLTLKGFVASVDGSRYISEVLSGDAAQAENLGIELAEKLIERGGKDILDEIRVNG
ncbi:MULTISPECIES: hydroxymethylbilane synthase [unclassified Saccharicrinis]|uniref:hydroxymethylbilane synthase n=1 Tax=unclassified Saccharicrinis TaxID=2646859 RepID=UPI0035E0CB6F